MGTTELGGRCTFALLLVTLAGSATSTMAQVATVNEAAELSPPSPAVSGPRNLTPRPTNPVEPVSPPTTSVPTPEVVPDTGAPQSPFTLLIGVDWVTGYYSKGFKSEDSGVIIQPYAVLSYDAASWEDGGLSVRVGTWHSLHSEETGANPSRAEWLQSWFEADGTAGATAVLGKVSIAADLAVLSSPNDAFETVVELSTTAALDDSPWLGAWAMNPYAKFLYEPSDAGSDGADNGNGVYLELGVTPGRDIDAGYSEPWRLNFPTLAGFSLSNYYENAANEDQTFGFFETGARLTIPLPIGGGGAWSTSVGVRFIFMGEALQEINADDDGFQAVGTLSLAAEF